MLIFFVVAKFYEKVFDSIFFSTFMINFPMIIVSVNLLYEPFCPFVGWVVGRSVIISGPLSEHLFLLALFQIYYFFASSF